VQSTPLRACSPRPNTISLRTTRPPSAQPSAPRAATRSRRSSTATSASARRAMRLCSRHRARPRASATSRARATRARRAAAGTASRSTRYRRRSRTSRRCRRAGCRRCPAAWTRRTASLPTHRCSLSRTTPQRGASSSARYGRPTSSLNLTNHCYRPWASRWLVSNTETSVTAARLTETARRRLLRRLPSASLRAQALLASPAEARGVSRFTRPSKTSFLNFSLISDGLQPAGIPVYLGHCATYARPDTSSLFCYVPRVMQRFFSITSCGPITPFSAEMISP
jgi:hypothetical protein